MDVLVDLRGPYFPQYPIVNGTATATAQFTDWITIYGSGNAYVDFHRYVSTVGTTPTIDVVVPTQITLGVPFPVSVSITQSAGVHLNRYGDEIGSPNGGNTELYLSLFGVYRPSQTGYEYFMADYTTASGEAWLGGSLTYVPEPPTWIIGLFLMGPFCARWCNCRSRTTRHF